MPEIAHREIVDKEGAAEYLGVSTDTIVRWAKKGIIGNKVGGLWRFSISQLHDYVDGKLQINRGARNESIQAGNTRESTYR